MAINRKIGPGFHGISIKKLPHIDQYFLSNGMDISEINLGTQDIVRIDIVFKAGRYFEHTKLSARLCAQLLKEGTITRSSRELSERIEYVGASLRTYANLDDAIVSLISLPWHLDIVLPLLVEILTEPAFPEEEFLKTIRTNQQSLEYELAKADVQAYRNLTEKIYGKDHPYGYNSTPSLYEGIFLSEVSEHFNRTYNINEAKLILSGKIDDSTRRLIDKFLSKINRPGVSQIPLHPIQSDAFGLSKYPMHNAVQTSYRFGFLLFNRNHKDYPLMYLFNTILGGYFGSRLMKNIREDKGYTYNIYSSLDLMNNSGYFYIAAETSHDMLDPLRKEIFLEIDRLKKEYVSEQELRMVKNYLFGSLLNYLDGPFNVAKTWKNLWLAGLSMADFQQFLNTIESASPYGMMEMANKYFDIEKSYEVICG
jgi:predicted Zn-dependent peptidase